MTQTSWAGFEPVGTDSFRMELPGKFFIHVNTSRNVGITYNATLKFPAGDQVRSKSGFRKLSPIIRWAKRERAAYLRQMGMPEGTWTGGYVG